MVNTTDKIVLGVLFLILVGMSGVFISAMSTSGDSANSDVGRAYSERALVSEITLEEAKLIALEAVPGNLGKVEIDNENGIYIYEVEIIQGEATKEVIIDIEGNILSVKTEEPDVPITGDSLERASQVALDYIGEGRVTDSEIGDEEGYYEIEITLDNGDEVDVHLDQDFKILSTEYD